MTPAHGGDRLATMGDLAGATIDIARIDWGLQMWTSLDWAFVLSSPVLVTTAGADGPHQTEVKVDVEPQPLPEPFQGLAGTRIVQVLVTAHGDLRIQLTDRHLTVQASRKYEAWEAHGPGGELIICSPGGELMHFAPWNKDPRED